MKASVKRQLDRRTFFKSAGAAAAGASAIGFLGDAELEGAVQNVNRNSIPSELKITDLRVATVVGAPMTCPLIRIDTNQGISGYGEVRDGGSATYALILKSRLLGENPCNVDKLFRKIKQFGHHARQAGGVCGVEMALWDLAGKAYGVPAYQMLGGRFRDKVRLYADTTEADNPTEQGKRLKARMDQGFTYLKQDFGINLLKDVPGALTKPLGTGYVGRDTVMHPFTGISITEKGVAWLSDWVGAVREVIGPEVPLSSDHYGHIDVNSCIRLAKAMEKHHLAWMEDMVPWQFGELMKQIRDATDIPILTGEDIYLKEDFNKLVDDGRRRHDPPRPRVLGRPAGDEEDRRLRDGARRRDGDALRRHARLVHGQPALRRRHRELHRTRAPLGGRALVGGHGDRPREADQPARLRDAARIAPGSGSSWSRRS